MSYSISYALVSGMAIDSNFPVVRLIFKNKSHVCSGVFLNAYTILTAAHCVSNKKSWEGLSLEIDSILDAKENKISVKQVKNIPHPDFQNHWYGSRQNSISFLFGKILSWGKSEITDPLGIDVSVAPNDSGGPLVDKKSNQIVGVLWGTYLSLTSKWGLPSTSAIPRSLTST